MIYLISSLSYFDPSREMTAHSQWLYSPLSRISLFRVQFRGVWSCPSRPRIVPSKLPWSASPNFQPWNAPEVDFGTTESEVAKIQVCEEIKEGKD